MKLKKYDLILVKKPKSVFGWLVKKCLNSPYSHVAIYIDNYHLIDTNFGTRVKIREIDSKLGDFDVYRYVREIKEEEQELIDEFLQRNLNAKYSILEAIAVWFKMNIRNKKRFICISLVTQAFSNARIYAFSNYKDFRAITENKSFRKINGG